MQVLASKHLLKSARGSARRAPGVYMEIDESQLLPLISYATKEKFDIERLILEALVQYQMRFSIDQNGERHKSESKKQSCKRKLKLSNEISIGYVSKGKIQLGVLLEKIEPNCTYVIGQYLNQKIILATTSNEVIDKIRTIATINIEKIETNQIFCWVTTFETPVQYYVLENGKGILIII